MQLKDAVLFVIDCSSNALKPLKAGGRSLMADAWLEMSRNDWNDRAIYIYIMQ